MDNFEQEKYDILKKTYKSHILNSNLKQYTLTVFLTDLCNLNCTNCQAYCGSISPYTMPFDLLKKNLLTLKKNLNFCDGIVFIGGEPLLHPNIKEICEWTRLNFPNIPISIFTNGIKFAEWDDNDFNLLKLNNIKILMTLYPTQFCINNTKNLEKKCKEKSIELEIHGIRPYFSKTSLNFNGSNNPDARFFSCCHADYPPSLFLKEDKIFHCNVLHSFFQYLPNIEIFAKDYITIQDLKINGIQKLKKLCSEPNESCKYCGLLMSTTQYENFCSDEIIFWNTQNNISSDYQNPLISFYLNDYEKYYKYCHECKHIIPSLKDPYFLSKAKTEFPSDPLTIMLKRFFKGSIDIYIPFNKDILNNSKVFLLKQGLKHQLQFQNFNFYFISIDKDKNAKEKMYCTFPPFSEPNENYYFLQANNFIEGKTTFFENSYLNIKRIFIPTEENIKKLFSSQQFFENEKEFINEKI